MSGDVTRHQHQLLLGIGLAEEHVLALKHVVNFDNFAGQGFLADVIQMPHQMAWPCNCLLYYVIYNNLQLH